MEYLIRESNQNDNNIIHNFNKELESHGFNFSLPVVHCSQRPRDRKKKKKPPKRP